jgi:hypothetical protein
MTDAELLAIAAGADDDDELEAHQQRTDRSEQ